jgi:hypothetical protein
VPDGGSGAVQAESEQNFAAALLKEPGVAFKVLSDGGSGAVQAESERKLAGAGAAATAPHGAQRDRGLPGL